MKHKQQCASFVHLLYSQLKEYLGHYILNAIALTHLSTAQYPDVSRSATFPNASLER